MLLVASGMFSMFYFASIYVQEILGYSPLKAGFAFLPFTFGIVIGAGAAQTLISASGFVRSRRSACRRRRSASRSSRR